MILEEDFIEQAVSGQLELPVLSDYHFYFDVEKALIKAKSDTRFKKLLEEFPDTTILESGLYYHDTSSTKFIILKLDKDFVIFLEGDDRKEMKGTKNCDKVIEKYFNLREETIQDSLVRGNLMKTYFHYFKKPTISSKMHTRRKDISLADYDYLKELFEELEVIRFESQHEINAWLEETDTDEPSNIIIGFENLYSLHVHSDKDNGFNIILGLKEGKRALEIIYANSSADTLDFALYYKQTCGVDMPYQVKQIIAACFK